MGVDPYIFVNLDGEDFVIAAAMLNKANDLRIQENENNAILLGNALAQIF